MSKRDEVQVSHVINVVRILIKDYLDVRLLHAWNPF